MQEKIDLDINSIKRRIDLFDQEFYEIKSILDKENDKYPYKYNSRDDYEKLSEERKRYISEIRRIRDDFSDMIRDCFCGCS